MATEQGGQAVDPMHPTATVWALIDSGSPALATQFLSAPQSPLIARCSTSCMYRLGMYIHTYDVPKMVTGTWKMVLKQVKSSTLSLGYHTYPAQWGFEEPKGNGCLKKRARKLYLNGRNNFLAASLFKPRPPTNHSFLEPFNSHSTRLAVT